MSNYRFDQSWETLWLDEVMSQIKLSKLLMKSRIERDMKNVEDLVLKVETCSIGVRIRRPEYFDKYKHEVTFRAKRDSGAETEWSKILRGEGDLHFYGFANPGWKYCKCIRRWTLVSLHAVRRIVIGRSMTLPFISNNDGTHFHAINVHEWDAMDAKFVVDANWGKWNP